MKKRKLQKSGVGGATVLNAHNRHCLIIRKWEYRAAAISATTLFEGFLWGRLDPGTPVKVSYLSMWKLIDYIFERQLVLEEGIPFIK